MVVEDREQQRADFFRIAQVQVCAAVDQILCAVDASLAGGIEQGSQSAGRPVDRARLGGDLPLPVVDRRPCVDVGAGRDERLHHCRLALRDRPHQCRLAAPALDRVDLRTAPQQRLGRIDAAGAGDDHQRGLAVRVGRFDVSAGRQQLVDDADVGEDRGLGHRRRAVVVFRVHLRARTNQPIDQIEIVMVHRPVQRGRAIGFGCVDIDALRDQRERPGAIAGFGRIHQRRPRRAVRSELAEASCDSIASADCCDANS